ncbi:MAG: LysM peptidoglycan-binding domain-containing protein [Solirubrobacteraceae bacterium]
MKLGTIARYVAPLILVAMLVTTVVVVSTSLTGDKEAKRGDGSQVSAQEKRRKRERRRARAGQKSYRVKQGDTLEVIAIKTKVSREELVRFNPELDPQALQPGQKLKLR